MCFGEFQKFQLQGFSSVLWGITWLSELINISRDGYYFQPSSFVKKTHAKEIENSVDFIIKHALVPINEFQRSELWTIFNSGFIKV